MRKLNIIYLEIGRGHPFYLDGIIEQLKGKGFSGPALNKVNIIDISSGLSKFLWLRIAAIYRWGSRGGLLSRLYGQWRCRRNADRFGLIEKILSRGIRKYLKTNNNPTLVSHPMLVPMIRGLVPVYYQHGEIAVPRESMVSNSGQIFVPLEQSKEVFRGEGLRADNIFVTGLCIEAELAAKASDMFEERVRRLASEEPLTGAFFSSGAEPPPHIDKIIRAVEANAGAGYRGIIFCRQGGRLEKNLRRTVRPSEFNSEKLPVKPEMIFGESRTALISFADRDDENRATCRLFSLFDYFVAPSHERTNWAVGMGLPMFILHPLIGSFAPLNRLFLLSHKTVVDLDTGNKADKFGEMLTAGRRDGTLLSMARNGFGKYRLDGFNKCADYLVRDLNK